MSRRTLAGTLAALVLTAGIGCGKVGPPRLPELAVPMQPEPVDVRNVANGIEISFRRPKKYRDGVSLEDLGSFEITRTCEHAPAPIPVADIPVVDHGRFQKQGRISLVDYDPQPGQICTYRVVAITLDDYRSAPADSAPIERKIPAARKP